LLATNNFKILALRRNEPGEVEVHDRDTDIFYVLEGSAKFVDPFAGDFLGCSAVTRQTPPLKQPAGPSPGSTTAPLMT
jgi:hypothetical protein